MAARTTTKIEHLPTTDAGESQDLFHLFLGDRKENLFKLGALRLRCYGNIDSHASECWLELPADDLWVFRAE